MVETAASTSQSSTAKPPRTPEDQFPTLIAMVNALGFLITVTTISFVDPQLRSHVAFGARSYDYGYWSGVLAVPVFLSVRYLLRRLLTRAGQCLAATLPFVVAEIWCWWIFRPEVPHAGFVGWGLFYITASVAATWLHSSKPDLSFVVDSKLKATVRIEALKSLLSAWQAIALGVGGAFLAALVPWSKMVVETNTYVVAAERDRFLLNSVAFMQLGLFGIAFLVGPVREVVSHLLSITRAFTLVREEAAPTDASSARDS